MASITRTNPADFGKEVKLLGKNHNQLKIEFGAGVNAKVGPTSAVAKTFEAIAGAGVNVVIIGPLHSTNNNVSIAVEGEFGTDTYDGSNSETIAAHLEDVVQALGTVDGVNLASATVTAKTYVL